MSNEILVAKYLVSQRVEGWERIAETVSKIEALEADASEVDERRDALKAQAAAISTAIEYEYIGLRALLPENPIPPQSIGGR